MCENINNAIKHSTVVPKIEITTLNSIKITKESNAGREMEENKDYEVYLSNSDLWSSYCVSGSNDLMMNKILVEAHSLCGGGRYQLPQYNKIK